MKVMKIKTQKGQITVEMVLLLAVMVSMSYLLLNTVFKKSNKTSEPIYAFISGPWKTIGGMMESGSWAKKEDAIKDHPNHWERMKTEEGIDP